MNLIFSIMGLIGGLLCCIGDLLFDLKRKGIGKQLLTYSIENYTVNELTVNEQNPNAKGF